MTAAEEPSKASASNEGRLDGRVRRSGSTRMSHGCPRLRRYASRGSRQPRMSRRNRRLRLAVERALALLPLPLDAALLAALRDRMDDGRENGEHHGRDPAEGERHGWGGRGEDTMNRSYRRG